MALGWCDHWRIPYFIHSFSKCQRKGSLSQINGALKKVILCFEIIVISLEVHTIGNSSLRNSFFAWRTKSTPESHTLERCYWSQFRTCPCIGSVRSSPTSRASGGTLGLCHFTPTDVILQFQWVIRRSAARIGKCTKYYNSCFYNGCLIIPALEVAFYQCRFEKVCSSSFRGTMPFDWPTDTKERAICQRRWLFFGFRLLQKIQVIFFAPVCRAYVEVVH